MLAVILVRHGKPFVDPDQPPGEWALSVDGVSRAKRLGRALAFDAKPNVVASTERKAIETAEALALGPVVTSLAFCEVPRPWYGDAAGLEDHVHRWFGGEAINGWEPLADAVSRFDAGLDEHDRDGLVVVSHGTVLTAWLASNGMVTEPFKFWQELRMPDAWKVGPTLVRCLPS